MYLLTMNHDLGVRTSTQNRREVGDEGGPSDNVLGLVMGGREQRETLVDMPTFGIQADEVVEEEREGNVVGGHDLGVDFSGMLDVLELNGGDRESSEMGRREAFAW
ncbi:hypothetical protein U1Q18_035622 [Sarracenia purpurea var. burkii]